MARFTLHRAGIKRELANDIPLATTPSSVCAYGPQDNENVRDLGKLNRDLSNVIFLTTESKKHTVEPADNVLVIPDYAPPGDGGGASTGGTSTGGASTEAPRDTALLDIVPLLELIWRQDVPDARAVCRSYEGTNVVEEFRRRNAAKAGRAAPAAGRAAAARPGLLQRFGFG
jgi:hypothetical protein